MNYRKWIESRTIVCITIVILGMTWLVLEFFLRGGREQLSILIAPSLVVSGVLVLLAVAVRPRESMRGEIRIGGELVGMVSLAIFVLFAAMLVLYAATFMVSIVLTALAWVLLGVLLFLAILMQLVVYGAYLGLAAITFNSGGEGRTDGDREKSFGLFAGGSVLLSLIIHFVTGKFNADFFDAFNFQIVKATWSLKHLIPDWTFVLDKLRLALATIDHGLIVSSVVTICSGLLGGLLIGLALRLLRQRLMVNIRLRRYLPLAAAPVPDEAALIGDEVFVSVLFYLFALWMGTMYWVLF